MSNPTVVRLEPALADAAWCPGAIGFGFVDHADGHDTPGSDDEGAPLWWPGGKVAGEHLPRWLAEHKLAPQPVHAPPKGALEVRRPVSAMAVEQRYLQELARHFRPVGPSPGDRRDAVLGR